MPQNSGRSTPGRSNQLRTVGPDGKLWFAEGYGNRIGCITTAGVLKEYALPSANSGPARITVGWLMSFLAPSPRERYDLGRVHVVAQWAPRGPAHQSRSLPSTDSWPRDTRSAERRSTVMD
jgi:hypothetical protein